MSEDKDENSMCSSDCFSSVVITYSHYQHSFVIKETQAQNVVILCV